MTVLTHFRPAGPLLVRATTDPGDLDVPSQLDLTDPAAVAQDGAAWLAKTWSRSETRHAVTLASPALAAELDRLLDQPARTTVKQLRRAITSLSSYLLRWQRRATPFGLFAGLTTATVGATRVAFGVRHRAVARVDAEWLIALIDRLELHPQLRFRLLVVADNTGVVRDGRLFATRRASLNAGRAVPLRETSVRYTRPVQAALALAATPVRVDALADALLDRFPAATTEQISAVVNELVSERFLVTNLRPPMTASDGLTHLIDAVSAAGGHEFGDVAAILGQLCQVHRLLARQNTTHEPADAAALRARATERMARLVSDSSHTLAVDMRLDAQISVPEAVVTEAALAASVLLRVTTKPFGSAAWLDYHSRFRARYGHGALVPVRDLLADSGLGCPTGYLGAPRAHPAWRTVTDRDATFLALVQRAALDGAEEIVLTDADVEALTVGEPNEVIVPERVEVGVAVQAASPEALDAGNFRLRIVATPTVPTSMAGRFTHLLHESDRAQLTASYTTGNSDALVVQLSFPPRRPHNDNVTRVPPLLPTVLALAEHPTGNPISLDDLAVTADGDQMYLVQISTGRRVVAHVPHALDTTVQTPPLARFLAEVGDARTAVFGPFDVGAARTLPYLPRIRYRRTILSPARWILTTDDLPHHSGDAKLEAWRRRWRLPAEVVLCHGELKLPLNLDHRLDRALLRNRLAQAGRAELQEDVHPDQRGWIGRPAELLIPMAATTPSRRALPPLTPPGLPERPGDSVIVHAWLAGNPARFDQIITDHLPRLDTILAGRVERWWLRRHRDLVRVDADQHLVLVLRLTDRHQYGPVEAQLATFAADLESRGLPAQLSLMPYQHHPGRYGHEPALATAEQVFAADTHCAVAQITLADRAGLPTQALAAASMVRIAAAFATDPASGYQTLVNCLPHQTGELDRTLRDHTLRLAEPGHLALLQLAGGDAVAAAWQARDTALITYLRELAPQRDPAGILPTLLHEHHVRALGIDPAFEKVTNRLARAAALRYLALAGAR